MIILRLFAERLVNDSAAKDLGVWHSAMVLPQLIATPIAGAVLDSVKVSAGPGPRLGAYAAAHFELLAAV